MEKAEELELAGILAKLKRKGFSVFAQYDFTKGKEILKGVFISSGGKEADGFLEQVIEIITTQKGLGGKQSK